MSRHHNRPAATVIDRAVEGLDPLPGLAGIDVGQLAGQPVGDDAVAITSHRSSLLHPCDHRPLASCDVLAPVSSMDLAAVTSRVYFLLAQTVASAAKCGYLPGHTCDLWSGPDLVTRTPFGGWQ